MKLININNKVLYLPTKSEIDVLTGVANNRDHVKLWVLYGSEPFEALEDNEMIDYGTTFDEPFITEKGRQLLNNLKLI